jgi:hemerythrin-like domain-containing protein
MLHEHEEGRMHIRAMQAALAGAGAGRRPDIQTFAAHARAYVELLRSHIIKEDQRLFPMANQVFSPEDQAQLLKQFTYAEHHDLGAGTHEKYLQLAEGLAERFHVPRASTVGCGCSHGKREQTGQLCPAEELPNCQPDDSGELGVGD